MFTVVTNKHIKKKTKNNTAVPTEIHIKENSLLQHRHRVNIEPEKSYAAFPWNQWKKIKKEKWNYHHNKDFKELQESNTQEHEAEHRWSLYCGVDLLPLAVTALKGQGPSSK